MGRVGAFFDIDGTIYRNSLMTEHFKKLIKYEVIDPLHWHQTIKGLYQEWTTRYGDYEEYLELLAEEYRKVIKGLNRDALAFVADQAIALNAERVYKFTRDRIMEHHKRGDAIFFISGSPDFLVERMAAHYQVTEWRGSRYHLDEDGCFTGEITRMWDAVNKAKTLRELVDKYEIDLSKSFAYGDTNGDLSMLTMVGKPYAVNPNGKLLDSIRRDPDLLKRTKVVVERKDMIYLMDANVSTMTKY